jgi:hypothetical protein
MTLQKNTYLSGIKSLKIALADQMTFSNVHLGTLKSFSYAGDFYEIPFSKNTGSFSVNAKHGAKGIVREKSASIFYPGITLDLVMLLDELIGQKIVVGVLTYEDQFFVLGSPRQPLRLSYEYNSGKALSDESGFEISFQAQNTISVMKSQVWGELNNYTVIVEDSGGTAIEGATVNLGGVEKTTDSSGQVTYNVAPDDYSLEVTAQYYSTHTETVTISSSGTKTVSLTQVSALYEITVEDTIGTLIPSAVVKLKKSGSTIYSAVTDNNGYASIIADMDSYDVVVSASYFKDNSDNVTINDHMTDSAVLQGTGVNSVRFVITDTSDILLENADIRLYDSSLGYDQNVTTISNGVGLFSMGKDEVPALYNWEVTKSGYDTENGTVQVDVTEINHNDAIQVSVTMQSS